MSIGQPPDGGPDYPTPSQGGYPDARPSLTTSAALSPELISPGRNFLIVGAGSLLTLIAFFVLPYVTASVQTTASIVAPVLDGICGARTCDYSVTAAQVLSDDGVVLLLPLLSLLAGGAVVLAALRTLPPRNVSALTPRNVAIGMAAGAVLGLLILANQLVVATTQVERALSVANSLIGLAGIHVAVALGFGFWAMVLGMLAILVGAVLELVRPTLQ